MNIDIIKRYTGPTCAAATYHFKPFPNSDRTFLLNLVSPPHPPMAAVTKSTLVEVKHVL